MPELANCYLTANGVGYMGSSLKLTDPGELDVELILGELPPATGQIREGPAPVRGRLDA